MPPLDDGSWYARKKLIPISTRKNRSTSRLRMKRPNSFGSVKSRPSETDGRMQISTGVMLAVKKRQTNDSASQYWIQRAVRGCMMPRCEERIARFIARISAERLVSRMYFICAVLCRCSGGASVSTPAGGSLGGGSPEGANHARRMHYFARGERRPPSYSLASDMFRASVETPLLGLSSLEIVWIDVTTALYLGDRCPEITSWRHRCLRNEGPELQELPTRGLNAAPTPPRAAWVAPPDPPLKACGTVGTPGGAPLQVCCTRADARGKSTAPN